MLKRHARKLMSLVLVCSITIGSIGNVSYIAYGEELENYDDFYVTFDVDNLAYTQRYGGRVYEIDENSMSYDELMQLFGSFFDDSATSYEPGTPQAIWHQELREVVYWITEWEVPGYEAPYYYGEEPLWESFSSSDRRGKTIYGDYDYINQATNDEAFTDLNIPEAREHPVTLALVEYGVYFTEDDDENEILWGAHGTYGTYFYTYIPQSIIDAGGMTDEEIETIYRRNRETIPDAVRYPDGTLPYTCMDPVDAISGGFLWNYTDLKVLGKHQNHFIRYYDSQLEDSSTLGNNWRHSYDYQLDVDDTKAYFSLPTGEGIPFTYDEQTSTFKPASPLQTDYTMGYYDSGNLKMGTNEVEISNRAEGGYMIKTHVEVVGNDLESETNTSQEATQVPTMPPTETTQETTMPPTEATQETTVPPTETTQEPAVPPTEATQEPTVQLTEATQETTVTPRVGATTETASPSPSTNPSTSPSINTTQLEEEVTVPSPSEDLSMTDSTEAPVIASEQPIGEPQVIADETMELPVQEEVIEAESTPEEVVEMLETEEEFSTSFALEAADGTDLITTIEKAPYDSGTDEESNINSRSNRAFDPEGKSYVIKHKDGTEYHFDANKNLTKIIQDGEEKYTFQYNTDNQLIKVVGRYDAYFDLAYTDEKITSVTDSAGNRVTYTYDANDNLVSSTNPDGDTLTYTYDDESNMTSVTDFAGEVYLSNIYDDKGRVIEQYVAGRGTSYGEYDDASRVNTFSDETGFETKYYYDENEVVTKVEDNRSNINNTYNEFGQVETQTDELGRITTFTYDDKGRQNSITYPDGTTTSTEYNDNNNPIKVTNPNGTTTEYAYDDRNNVTEIKDEKGNREYFEYDDADNLLSHEDMEGNTTAYTYDDNGFLKTVTDPSGGVTSYTYDEIGKLLEIKTPMGKTTSYTYSDAGKLLSVTDPDGVQTTYAPDENGLNASITDKRGNIEHYTYNQMNQVLSETDFMDNETTYVYDERGMLSQATDPAGYTTKNIYDDKGRLIAVTDKNNGQTSYAYDAASQLTSLTSPEGNTSAYTYDNMGRIYIETDPRNAQTTNTYDDMGRIKTQTDHLGGTTTYSYDEKGNLTAKTDKNGHVTSYEYNKNDQITKIILPDGSINTFTYDANGRVISVNDHYENTETTVYNADGSAITSNDKEGNETTYEYDEMGRIAKITFPDGTYETNTYDAVGNLTQKTDILGNAYTYEYNANNQLTKTTDPENNVTTMTYTNRGELSTMTTPGGGTVTYSYDGNGNLVKETNPLLGVTENTYDKDDRLTQTKDPIGAITTYTYDQNGNLLTQTQPTGGVTTYTYDELNRNTKITYADGSEVTMAYDAMGNLTYVKDPEGAETTYTYDAQGRMLEMKDPLGNIMTYTYDKLGQVVSITNQNGAATRTEYTPNGNVARTINAVGGVTEYTYDAMNRVTSVKDPKGGVTAYTYNQQGQVETETDPAGKVTTFTYDSLSRIKTVTDPNSGVQSYTYDQNGNVISTTDQNGISTSYEYDSMNNMTKLIVSRGEDQQETTIYKYNKIGQPVEEINPANLAKTYAYDKDGNLTVVKDEAGGQTTNAYDLMGNLTKTSYPDGKEAMYYYNKNSEIVKLEDWNGTTTFALDPLSRLKEVTDHNQKTTKYEYDGVGNKTAMTYPNGNRVEYTYDNENQLTKVVDADGEATAYTYDAVGNQLSQTNANGEKTLYAYNNLNLRTSATETLNGENRRVNEYAYDEMGNVVEETQADILHPALNKTKSYEYDLAGQLVEDKETSLTLLGLKTHENAYTYDSAGNMVEEKNKVITGSGLGGVTTNSTTNYTYNNLNQMLTKTTSTGDYTYEYDPRGNLVTETKDGEAIKSYEYDGTNRMVTGTNNETSEESAYTFNALGKRIQRTQTIENPNGSYQNNVNYAPEEYGEIVAEIASRPKTDSQGNPIPLQKTYEDNLGLTRQTLPMAEIKTDYVIDYTSYINNDIMAYESGSYVTEYVYGNGNDKISQKVSHESGLTDEELGENPNTNIAVDSIGKVYFHENRLGSTAYVSDADGELVSYAEYDAWGAIEETVVIGKWENDGEESGDPEETDDLHDKYDDMNLAGVDDSRDYTGHNYDKVLEKYFAQARMYDPVNKRFVAEDDIKDGENWYGYCGNNPVNYVDFSGLKYVEFTFDDGDTIWIDEDHVVTVQALDDILYAQTYYKAAPEYMHKMANEARGRLPGDIMIGDEQEFSGLLNKIASSTATGNSLADTKKAIEMSKEIWGTSAYGLDEIVENAIGTAWSYVEAAPPGAGGSVDDVASGIFKGVKCVDDAIDGAKCVDDVVEVVGKFNFSGTAAKHMDEAGRAVPIQTLDDAIQSGTKLPDPQGTSANMFYSTMWKNGKMYNLEVLYDEASNTIMHFKYTPGAIGPLPEILK